MIEHSVTIGGEGIVDSSAARSTRASIGGGRKRQASSQSEVGVYSLLSFLNGLASLPCDVFF